MSYEPPDDEVKDALSRTHFERYRYFLAVAAQTREIWGFGDGEAWATIDDESGKPLFALSGLLPYTSKCGCRNDTST